MDRALSVQLSFPRTRESRLDLRELAWIPAFAGMTVPSELFVLPGAQIFSKGGPGAAKPQPNTGISRAKLAKTAK